MRRIWKWVRRGVLSVLLLVALALIFIHTPPGQDLVQDVVEDRLRERFVHGFFLGDLEFVLLGEVTLSDLIIYGNDGEVAVTIERLDIRPSWGDVLSGAPLHLEALAFTGMKVDARRRPEGGTNLKGIYVRPAGKPPMWKRGVTLDAIALDDLTLTLDGAPLARDVSLRGHVDFRADGQLDAAFEQVSGLALAPGRPDGVPLKLETLSAKVVERAELVLAGLEVGELLSLARLEAELPTAPTAETPVGLSLRGLELRAAPLAELLGQRRLASDVRADVSVEGPAGALSLEGEVRTGGGTLTLAGTLDVSDPKDPAYDLAIVGRNVAPSKIVVPRPGSRLAGLDVAADLRVSIKGHGVRPGETDAEVQVDVDGASLAGEALEALSGLSASISTRQGAFALDRVTLDVLGQEISLDGSVDPASGRFEARLDSQGQIAAIVTELRRIGVPLPDVARAVPAHVDVDVVARGKLAPPAGAIDARLPGRLPIESGFMAGSIAVRDVRLGEMSARSIDVALDLEHRSPVPFGRVDYRARDVDLGTASDGTELPTLERVDLGLSLDEDRFDGELSLVSAELDATLSAVVTGRVDLERRRVDLTVKRLQITRGDDLIELVPPWSISLPDGLGFAGAVIELAPLALRVAGARIDLGGRVAFTADPVAPRLDLQASRGWIHARGVSIGRLSALARRLGRSLRLPPIVRALAGRALVDLRADVGPEHADTQLKVRRGGRTLVALDAAIPLSGFRPDRAGVWRVAGDIDVPLPLLPLASKLPPAVDASSGRVKASVRLEGPLRRFDGSAALDLDGLRVQGQPVHLAADVRLRRGRAAIDAKASFAGRHLADLSGTLSPGAGKPTTWPATLKLDLTTLTPADWADLDPRLAELPGQIAGDLTLSAPRGVARDPEVQGLVTWTGWRTGLDRPGELRLTLEGRDTATVKLAASAAGAPLLAFEGSLPRAQALAFARKKGDALPVQWRLTIPDGDPVDLVPRPIALRRGIPAKLADLGASARLEGDLRGEVTLTRLNGSERPAIQALEAAGGLRLHDAELTMPGTHRVIKDIGLALEVRRDGVHLTQLSALERDAEAVDRTVSASGVLTFKNPGEWPLELDQMTLDLKTRKWLVLGKPDAPEATLDLDATITARPLAKPLAVDVAITHMDLLAPHRYIRDHFQQSVGLNDIVYLDEAKVRPGQLPQVPKKFPAKPLAIPPDLDLDLAIHLPPRAHALKIPIELWLTGDLRARVSGGQARVTGNLELLEGTLLALGHHHHLVEGAATLPGPLDQASLSLTFRKPASPALLPQLTALDEDGGSHHDLIVTISAAKGQQVSWGGAAGTFLPDAMALANAGTPMRPADPRTASAPNVSIPGQELSMVLTFLNTNLSHLVFLDRFKAWADPGLGAEAYGRVVNVDLVRYFGDDRRLRIQSRPEATARSTATISYDWLFSTEPRSRFGLGVGLGSEPRTGVELFYEWSSRE